MSKTQKKSAVLILIGILLFAVCVVWISCTHVGRASWNIWMGSVQKTDDATRYQTRKEVENACRAMVSSYEADRITYEQYRNSNNSEKQSWAEQAKMRANKTAATYNHYVLENSFVWRGNVPEGIKSDLPYLE